MDEKEITDNLGLTFIQGKILIELMKMGGEGTAPDLHEKLNKENIKRTTIYSSLEKLINDGLVIESDREGKQKVYGLVHTSPELLIKEITKSRDEAVKSFQKLLTKAREESKHSGSLDPLAYYSIKGRKRLLEQIESLISDSQKYILIQANVPMLEKLFSIIGNKKNNAPDVKIFVQMTWNPDSSIDINAIYNKYRNLLGEDYVSLPHKFYDEIFGFYQGEYSYSIPDEFKFSKFDINKTHFIQLLTDEGTVLGVHFGSKEGGGHFTRDPFTTQSHYVIFFLIFEESKGKKIDRNVLKEIMFDRAKKNFLLALEDLT
ncbi:MAG: hypothetical protein ACFFD1_12960 [Candidatus Thorarchaeota archaeon]